jgi:hypothetical protein
MAQQEHSADIVAQAIALAPRWPVLLDASARAARLVSPAARSAFDARCTKVYVKQAQASAAARALGSPRWTALQVRRRRGPRARRRPPRRRARPARARGPRGRRARRRAS